ASPASGPSSLPGPENRRNEKAREHPLPRLACLDAFFLLVTIPVLRTLDLALVAAPSALGGGLVGPLHLARRPAQRMAMVLRRNAKNGGRDAVVGDVAERTAVARGSVPPTTTVDVPVPAVTVEVEIRLRHVVHARRRDQDDLRLGIDDESRGWRRIANVHSDI